MGRKATALLLCSTWTLSGCNWVIDHFNDTYSEVTTANPISTDYEIVEIDPQNGFLRRKIPVTMTSVPDELKTSYIATVTLDSVKKCRKLLVDTGLTTRGVNSNFDLLTTALTALATAMTPIGTVHALTAAASISSGFKGVFNSDIYGQQAAPIIGTEIASTYLAEMKKYVAGLTMRAAANPSSLNPPLEVINITFIHEECDIDKAIGDLNAKARIAATEAKSTPMTASDIKVGYIFPSKQNGTIWKVTAIKGNTVTIQQANGKTVLPLPMDSILIMANGSL